MSKVDLERLSQDMTHNPGLRLELEQFGGRSDEITRWARSRGYELADDEANGLGLIEELDDDDLEEVAGGWTGDPDP